MDRFSPADTDALTRLDRYGLELSRTLLASTGDSGQVLAAATRRIGELLDVDRCALVLYTDQGLSTAHEWTKPGVSIAAADLRSLGWYESTLLRGEKVVLQAMPLDLPFEARSEAGVRALPVKSHLAVPVVVAGRKVCALCVDVVTGFKAWSPACIDCVTLVAEILANAVHRDQQAQSLREVTRELAGLRNSSGREREYLREEVDSLHGFDEIVGESPALKGALDRLLEVASTDATVLLLGETGTGKEVFARALHARSPRRARPLIRVNCAALPATLIEGELFGHERGAFTGAITARQGRFELAHTGTLFLDEIGDFPLDLQVKLLRVLQEGEFERLGSSQTHNVDVRLIAATHHDLNAAKAHGRFRTDLFYRLNVFPIHLPPLRERRDDIPRLVWYIVHQRQRDLGRTITHIPAHVMTHLQEYEWPGNVRELENVVERAMIRTKGDALLLPERLGAAPPIGTTEPETLWHVERRHIEDVLQRCDWRINGTGNAADVLGIHPNTLRFRMKKLQITRPAKSAAEGHPTGL